MSLTHFKNSSFAQHSYVEDVQQCVVAFERLWSFAGSTIYVYSIDSKSLIARVPLLSDVDRVLHYSTLTNPSGFVLSLSTSDNSRAIVFLDVQTFSLSVVCTPSFTISSIASQNFSTTSLILLGTDQGHVYSITLLLHNNSKLSFSTPLLLTSSQSQFVYADGANRSRRNLFVSSLKFFPELCGASTFYFAIGYSFGYFDFCKIEQSLDESFSFTPISFEFVSDEARTAAESSRSSSLVEASPVLNFTYLSSNKQLVVTSGTHQHSSVQHLNFISFYRLNRNYSLTPIKNHSINSSICFGTPETLFIENVPFVIFGGSTSEQSFIYLANSDVIQSIALDFGSFVFFIKLIGSNSVCNFNSISLPLLICTANFFTVNLIEDSITFHRREIKRIGISSLFESEFTISEAIERYENEGIVSHFEIKNLSLTGLGRLLSILIELRCGSMIADLIGSEIKTMLNSKDLLAFIVQCFEDIDQANSFMDHNVHLFELLILLDGLLQRPMVGDQSKIQLVVLRTRVTFAITANQLETWAQSINFDSMVDFSRTSPDNSLIYISYLTSFLAEFLSSNYPFNRSIIDESRSLLTNNELFSKIFELQSFEEITFYAVDLRLKILSLILYSLFDQSHQTVDTMAISVTFINSFSLPPNFLDSVLFYYKVDTNQKNIDVLPNSIEEGYIPILFEHLVGNQKFTLLNRLLSLDASTISGILSVESLVQYLAVGGFFAVIELFISNSSNLSIPIDPMFLFNKTVYSICNVDSSQKKHSLLKLLVIYPWSQPHLLMLSRALSETFPLKAVSLLLSRGYYIEAAELLALLPPGTDQSSCQELVISVARGLPGPQRVSVLKVCRQEEEVVTMEGEFAIGEESIPSVLPIPPSSPGTPISLRTLRRTAKQSVHGPLDDMEIPSFRGVSSVVKKTPTILRDTRRSAMGATEVVSSPLFNSFVNS
ncbi:hypothetical protein P9112_004154 [Eukaryota sp. TZLM1-RC]